MEDFCANIKVAYIFFWFDFFLFGIAIFVLLEIIGVSLPFSSSSFMFHPISFCPLLCPLKVLGAGSMGCCMHL
jgi:hypothetical protein